MASKSWSADGASPATTIRAIPLDALIALLILYVLWGSTYFGIKVALISFPPFLMGGIRFTLAGACMFAFLALRRAPMPTRRQWLHSAIFGALLVDLYEVFLRPGVHYTSGFFGPAERFLRDSGADVQFAPADFRRFEPILQALCPRIMTTVATPPDADGYLSLSVHAGASVGDRERAGSQQPGPQVGCHGRAGEPLGRRVDAQDRDASLAASRACGDRGVAAGAQ